LSPLSISISWSPLLLLLLFTWRHHSIIASSKSYGGHSTAGRLSSADDFPLHGIVVAFAVPLTNATPNTGQRWTLNKFGPSP
jgi:hypothetical protein